MHIRIASALLLLVTAGACADQRTTPVPIASQHGVLQVATVATAPASECVQAAVGGLLVVIGGVLLAHNLGWLKWPWWASLETLWPLALVALGVGLVVKSRRPAAG